MNVYTYYTHLDGPAGLWDDYDQLKLIDLWRKSWAKQGWTPIVMDESWAKRHPRYREFKQKFWSLPTEYGHEYDGSCLLRYAAMSAAGGGMMTDYDVMNYSFSTVAPDPHWLRLYTGNTPISTGCCLAPYELYEGICQLFMEWEPGPEDWNPNAKPPQMHCSDMTYLLHCLDGRKNNPGWIQSKPGCSIYPDTDWKTAPMVHFTYAVRAAGHWPKWKAVEAMRPI
jgi:hypothetical protein